MEATGKEEPELSGGGSLRGDGSTTGGQPTGPQSPTRHRVGGGTSAVARRESRGILPTEPPAVSVSLQGGSRAQRLMATARFGTRTAASSQRRAGTRTEDRLAALRSSGSNKRRSPWRSSSSMSRSPRSISRRKVHGALSSSRQLFAVPSSSAQSSVLRSSSRPSRPSTTSAASSLSAVRLKERVDAMLSKKLLLPRAYSQLLEAFNGLETVMNLYKGRKGKGILTYSVVRKAVERVTKVSFTRDHMAQIVHLFPEAYTVRVTKVRNRTTRKLEWVHEILWTSAEQGADVSRSPDKRMETEGVLRKRKAVFLDRLYQGVHKAHVEFEDSQGIPPTELAMLRKSGAWNPDFKLESAPPLEGKLPPLVSPAMRSEHKKNGGTDDNLRVPSSSELRLMALYKKAKLAPAASSSSSPSQTPQSSSKSTPPASPSLSDSSVGKSTRHAPRLSLLEEVRLRSRRKSAEAAAGGPGERKRVGHLGELPQLAVSIRTFYKSKRCRAMPMKELVEQLSKSEKSIQDELKQKVEEIKRLVPDWCSIESLGGQSFVRVDMGMNIQDIKRRLRQKYIEARNTYDETRDSFLRGKTAAARPAGVSPAAGGGGVDGAK